MSVDTHSTFETFLRSHDESVWAQTVERLLPSIHEVDKVATKIWFSFFPLALARALEESDEPEKLARKLNLKGRYHLKDQIDSSHQFLYGHRYWPQIKAAVVEHAGSSTAPSEIAALARAIAVTASTTAAVEESLLVGIALVALMTVTQAGMAAFASSPGTVGIPPKVAAKSPAQVLKERAKDDSQGLLGFLKTVDQKWTVTFNENEEDCRYTLINRQDLATAGANDTRDYKSRDARCVEGPIPVECRTASCGVCWVGVLGGADKIVDVGVREGAAIKSFGYINTDEKRPHIRMACMAKTLGAVSVVVPPWSGVIGRYLEERDRPVEEAVAQG